MIQSEAKVVCNFCWREIGKREVYALSPEKRIKVVTEMCPDCRSSFRYDYNDFGFIFGIASVMLRKSDPEKMLMRDFVDYSNDRLGVFKQMPAEGLREIVNVHSEDLIKLRDLASRVDEHRQKVSVTEIVDICSPRENPFKKYEAYVNDQIKKQYSKK